MPLADYRINCGQLVTPPLSYSPQQDVRITTTTICLQSFCRYSLTNFQFSHIVPFLCIKAYIRFPDMCLHTCLHSREGINKNNSYQGTFCLKKYTFFQRVGGHPSSPFLLVDMSPKKSPTLKSREKNYKYYLHIFIMIMASVES